MPTSKHFERFLNNKRTLQGIDFSGQTDDAVSRLQLFNLSGMDYQGQVSSGYGQSGVQGSIGAGIDLTDFLAPLIPLPVGAGANITLTGEGLSEYLILIQRYPEYLYKFIPEQNTQTREWVLKPHLVWHTYKPLCLSGFQGYSGAVSLNGVLSAGAEIPFPSLPDELGLEVDVSATAETQGKLTGKMIRLNGWYTGAFPSPSDIAMRTQYNLERVLDLLFAKPDKSQLKTEIDAWIEDMVANWLSAYRQPELSTGSKRDRLKNFARRQIQKIPFSEVSDSVQNLLNELIFSLINFEVRLPVLGYFFDKWKNYQSTSGLMERLKQLKIEISNYSPRPDGDPMPPNEKVNALRQIQTYIDLLLICQKRLNPTAVPGLNPSIGHFFNLFSFAAEASATASANAGAGAAVTIPLANVQIKANSGIGGMAGASADIQCMASRYQSSLDNRSGDKLYFTQDTWITCKSVKANAEAFAELSLSPLSYQKKKERAGVYNTMTYQSMCFYWSAPASLIPGVRIQTKPGSGLRKGMSFATRRLIDYAKSIANGTSVTDRKMAKISNAATRGLNITPAQFNTFIQASDIGSMDPTQEGFPAYVFLEAAFAVSDKFSINIKGNSDGVVKPESVATYRRLMRSEIADTPQSIRLRIRICDAESNEIQIFKLGFPAAAWLGIPRINVDLSVMKGAGQQGMFDYYVHWFENPILNTDPIEAKKAQEFNIPPVVFLHL